MEEDDKGVSGTRLLTGQAVEAEDVLAGAEPWEPIETKLVLWSLAAAVVALAIGLFVVPTSVLH